MQLQHQAAFELDVGGEQCCGGQQFAQHLAQRRRVVGVRLEGAPDFFKLHDAALDRGVLEYETGEGVGHYFSALAHESLSVTVRLNTGAPGWESLRSATK
jgi:hypothetical protein